MVNKKKDNPFSIWLVLDITVNVFTMIAVVTIMANSIKGFMMTFVTALFLLWTFRPLYLAFKEFISIEKKKSNNSLKMHIKKINLFFYLIFLVLTLCGGLLFVNRYAIHFISDSSWSLLFDHFTAGFLVPLWFFILYLGIGSFFHPDRKIIYSIKWFSIMTCFALLMPVLWDGIIQRFRDIDQIIWELVGIGLSWTYFLYFRKIKLSETVLNKTKKEENKE